MYRFSTALLLVLGIPASHGLPSIAPVASTPVAPAARFWGPEGHRLVARIAMARLDSTATAAAARLLNGQSLADVSSWPDQIRSERPATGPWHYIDISILDSSYVPSRDCPPEGCIITALQQQMDLLADRTRSDSVRREALMWVVHLMGDLSQPLHVGERGDRGGNDVKLTFLGRPTNLHALWDSGLLDAFGWTEDQVYTDLMRQIAARADIKQVEGGTIVSWAMESHDLSRDVVYRNLPASLTVDGNYRDQVRVTVMDQLLRGGVRLAAVLNRILAGG
jgi:hypothetical protein